MILLWKLVVVLNIVLVLVDCQFESQYLGNYLTFDEYNKLKIGCDSTICLRDSQFLLLRATQNKTIEPCNDFKEFSLGRFIKLAALDDRKESVGFFTDIYASDWERIRKVLAAKVTKNDINPLKVAKNYYRKCVNSDYVRQNGTAEILQHLKSLGDAPFLNTSWDERQFDIKELFEKETREAVYYFLHHDTGRCSHPQNKSVEVFCLKSIVPSNFSQELIDDLASLYKGITHNKTLVQVTADKINDLLKKQENFLQIKANPTIFTISELNNYTKSSFNWLTIINAQLTNEAQLTDDSEILIDNPELILNLFEMIKDTPKSTLADVYAFNFLYKYKRLFVVYPFDRYQELKYGAKKSEQRWLQCSDFMYYTFGPSLQALYAAKYFNLETQVAVINFTKEVVGDFMTNMITINNFSDYIKHDLMNKLSNIEYLVGYPKEALNLPKLEEFYDELDLNGTEGLVETYLEIYKFGHKMNNNPLNNWKKKLNDRSFEYHVKYYTDDNILYIPSVLIQYPYYHPNRSRFFNTATLFKDTAVAMNKGIKNYLMKHKDIQYEQVNEFDLAYNNYANWEKSGGKELQLPGFFLTNRQMFWISLANTNFYKIHPDNKRRSTIDKYRLEHLHTIYKSYRNFRDIYNCTELTEDEEQIIEIYKNLLK